MNQNRDIQLYYEKRPLSNTRSRNDIRWETLHQSTGKKKRENIISTIEGKVGITGNNKIYKLLKNEEIFSKRIGRDYYIPKISIIKYLIEK